MCALGRQYECWVLEMLRILRPALEPDGLPDKV